MKHIAIAALLTLMAAIGTTGCEPKECREFKDLICTTCGTGSAACKSVKKRRGRDDKKCKSGLDHVKARAGTAEGKKTLCTLLNDERPK